MPVTAAPPVTASVQPVGLIPGLLVLTVLILATLALILAITLVSAALVAVSLILAAAVALTLALVMTAVFSPLPAGQADSPGRLPTPGGLTRLWSAVQPRGLEDQVTALGCEAGLRTAHHGQGNRAAERRERVRRGQFQQVIEAEDLRPVGFSWFP